MVAMVVDGRLVIAGMPGVAIAMWAGSIPLSSVPVWLMYTALLLGFLWTRVPAHWPEVITRWAWTSRVLGI